LIRVTDIAGIVAVARRAGARVTCDNTWATPMLTRPLELGADLVMHSTTKYLGGHSDVLNGALIGREDDDLFQRIRGIQITGGPSAAQIGRAQPRQGPAEAGHYRRGVRRRPTHRPALAEHSSSVVSGVQDPT